MGTWLGYPGCVFALLGHVVATSRLVRVDLPCKFFVSLLHLSISRVTAQAVNCRFAAKRDSERPEKFNEGALGLIKLGRHAKEGF